jgi:ribosomal protein S18 acetylase RimI-like enzyme
MKIDGRPYQDASDLETIVQFLSRIRRRQRLADYPSVVDLQELFSLAVVQRRTRLWSQDPGRLAGYAFVDDLSNLHWEADPDLGDAFEEALLEWAIAEARQAAQERQQSDPPGISCRSDDRRRIVLLEQRGFRGQPGALHLARSLERPIPTPVLPPGFSLRPSRGAAEAEAWVALHRAAHQTELMTVERRLSIIGVTGFDPALDLVAVAPDGRLAAYCVGSISRRENELTGCKVGYTDPVATHPDFQRRGLCRALLCAVMQSLRERGMDTARLGTSRENQAMRLAAEGVGFRVESETFWYELPYP